MNLINPKKKNPRAQRIIFTLILILYCYIFPVSLGALVMGLSYIPYLFIQNIFGAILSILLSIILLYVFFWFLPRLLWRNSGSKINYILLTVTSILCFLLAISGMRKTESYYDLAKQKEPSTLIAAYIKASFAYYTEYGTIAKSSKDLGQYISVTGCSKNDSKVCKKATPTDHTYSNSTTWYSPSGNYEITMQAKEKGNIFIAKPSGKYSKKGLGVSGCYNSQTGATDILEMTTKGRDVTIPDCSK